MQINSNLSLSSSLHPDTNQDDKLRIEKKLSASQDIAPSPGEPTSRLGRLRKRCSLDKVGPLGSLSSLNERIISSADRLNEQDPAKYGQLRLIDDDTNEDDEEENSIASCPPATQHLAAAKSSLISKLKTNNKLVGRKGENGACTPPEMQLRQRKYLHFTKPPSQDTLPPAFRQRRAIGHNLLAERSDRTVGFRAGGMAPVRGVGQMPRKALRFSQQLNSSGSSAGSPIFNSIAERRRAQFMNLAKAPIGQASGRGSRRNSGASVHSMLYDPDGVTAAVAAAQESTADSLERMDSQLHGLNDEVYRLSSDVKLSLYLLKQMCDLATASLLASKGEDKVEAGGKLEAGTEKPDATTKVAATKATATDKDQQSETRQCNCNSKLIEQLKNISSNIEASAQLKGTGQQLSKQAGILKHNKRSISSNSSQSLTDMINEHRQLLCNQTQQRVKLNARLAKCSSHSSLTLPLHHSPPAGRQPAPPPGDLKLASFSAVRFTGLSKNIDQIKELNEFKSGELKQSSLEEEKKEVDSGETLRNARHSWNSLSQFADSSSSNEPIEAASRSVARFADAGQDVGIEIAGVEHEGSAGREMATHEVLSSDLVTGSTIYSQSNGNPPNLSCAIDIGPGTDEASESEKP